MKKQTIRQISSLTVSGSTEQFYDLTPLVSWTKSEDGTHYVGDYDIVILNDSDVVLSLTKFKTAFATPEAAETAELVPVSSRRTLNFAAMAVKKVLTTADTSTLDFDWVTQDLTAGAEAELKITTSAEIVAINVGDTEFTDYVQNEDGSRTWTVSFTVKDTGDDNLLLTLKDAFGRTSETISTTIPMAETEEPDPAQPETDEPDGAQADESFFGRLRRIVNWLLELFRRIISFFRSL